jgi:hypothetical protein
MTRVMGIVKKMILTGENIEDHRIVPKVLRSLHNKFEMAVTTILELRVLTNFSIEEMMGSLMCHQTRLTLEEWSMEHAFKTLNNFMQRWRKHTDKSKGRGRGNQNLEEKHTKE